MTPDTFRPPIPRPPNDPTSLLLDGRVGWSAGRLDNLVFGADGELELDLLPHYRRRLSEESGSFGGLTVPTNIAVSGEGDLFLLAPRGPDLKLFDPCKCRFDTVPAIGGAGAGAREFNDPHGIGIRGGTLFVCDTGNHRLSLFTLRGFALQGYWRVPPSAGLVNDCEPYDLAFDRAGRVYVSDGANGCVHRFSPRGQWQTCFAGFGVVTHLAIDCRGLLYAVSQGVPASVHTLSPDGAVLPVSDSTDPVRGSLPPPPFTVNLDGLCDLAALCSPEAAAGQSHWFDLDGEEVSPSPDPHPANHEREGSYCSLPLDSRLYRCQWHRVILHGALPPGCQVQIDTYTAETALSPGELAALPPEQWQTRQIARVFESEHWDCLVRSPAGRYLLVRLTLRGNGVATPSLAGIEIEFPRLTPLRYLPAVFGEEPVSADFTDRFLSLYGTILEGFESALDNVARYFDPLSAPAKGPDRDFLSWLAMWIGITLDRRWPEARRRRFLKESGSLFALRGTPFGLWRQLLIYLEMQAERFCRPQQPRRQGCAPRELNCAPPEESPCRWTPPPLILEHFRVRSWLFAGSGRLNEDSVLWGKSIVNRSQLGEGARADRTQLKMTQDPFRDPFYVTAHKFSVFVPARFGKTDQDKKALESLLKSEKPAHTECFVHYVSPLFRVGLQATIGLDAVVARLPHATTLNEAALGTNSVLGGASATTTAPPLQRGEGPRVGTTTVVD